MRGAILEYMRCFSVDLDCGVKRKVKKIFSIAMCK